MSEDEVLNTKGCQIVKDRLDSCSFRGAVEVNGELMEVPMCKVNAVVRPRLYQEKLAKRGQVNVQIHSI